MKKKVNEKLRARFAREVRFDVPTVPYRETETTALEELKARLLRQLLEQTTELTQNTVLRRAANDAAALAWLTRYPLLAFPALLEEKAKAALLQCQRQAGVRQRSLNLLLKAA
ncbi:MAG: hypothetical protein JWQ04_3005 [Pedosphaera sp.]|nr:hypothetical protein [Pedosphaera sp.]